MQNISDLGLTPPFHAKQTETPDMTLESKIITNYVNGLFMKKIMKEKGWTKQQAVYAVADYISCGEKVSPYDFFKTYEQKPVAVH